MPLFRYKCTECSHEFEELVLSSKEKVFCPKCSSENLKKLFPNKFNTGANSSGSSIPSSKFS